MVFAEKYTKNILLLLKTGYVVIPVRPGSILSVSEFQKNWSQNIIAVTIVVSCFLCAGVCGFCVFQLYEMMSSIIVLLGGLQCM